MSGDNYPLDTAVQNPSCSWVKGALNRMFESAIFSLLFHF